MGEDKPSPLAAYRVRLQCLGESSDDHRTITSHNHESSTSTFLPCEGWVKHAAGRHLAFPRVLAFALALCARCTGSGLATLVLLRCVAKGPPHDSAFHSASHSACHFFFACRGIRAALVTTLVGLWYSSHCTPGYGLKTTSYVVTNPSPSCHQANSGSHGIGASAATRRLPA